MANIKKHDESNSDIEQVLASKPAQRKRIHRGHRSNCKRNKKVFDIWSIGNDGLVEIIFYLNIKEFASARQICKHFNKLIKDPNRMNKFWKYQSKKLCCSISNEYNTNNWHEFYSQIHTILKKGNYYTASIYTAMIKRKGDRDDISNDAKPWLSRTINPSLVEWSTLTWNSEYSDLELLSNNAYFASIKTKKRIKETIAYYYEEIIVSISKTKDLIMKLTDNDNGNMKLKRSKNINIESVTSKHGAIKLITDDYGFDLQLIDLICKYDCYMVLDMLLLNKQYDIFEIVKFDNYNYNSKFAQKHNMDKQFRVIDLFFCYSAKYASIKLFCYLVQRYGDEMKIKHLRFYNNVKMYDYYKTSRYGAVLKQWDNELQLYDHLLYIALEGGSDKIVNHILNGIERMDDDDQNRDCKILLRYSNCCVNKCVKGIFHNFTNWFRLDKKERIKKSTINAIIDRYYHCINVAQTVGFYGWRRTELGYLLCRCCQYRKEIEKSKSKSKKFKFAKEIIQTIMQHEKISENIESAIVGAMKLGYIKILAILLNKKNINIFAVRELIYFILLYKPGNGI